MSDGEYSKLSTTSERMGYFLILSHSNFSKMKGLKGPKIEIEILKKAGENLGFDVEALENQSKEDIFKKLTSYAKKEDLNTCTCFLMAITTHGEEPDTLVASDDKRYKLSEVLEQFNKSNCSGLEKKPKIFIIDACRGVMEESRSSAPVTLKRESRSDNMVDQLTSPAQLLPLSPIPPEADEPLKVLTVPMEEHFFVAQATHSGFAAEDHEKGSVFIRTLSEALKDQQFRDIIEVFTFVNHKTSEISCSINKPQMPSFTFSLTENFELAKEAQQQQLGTYVRSYQKDVFLRIFSKEYDDDVKLLEDTGRFLSFEVKEWQENMTIQEMKDTANNNYENCNVFVCVIKTESKARDQLFDAQDEIYSLFDFVRCFNGKDCKGLWGKPKIFLIQAPVRRTSKGGNPDEVALSIPNTADTLIVYSEGSAFIKTLCEHLKKYTDTTDLLGILLMVNKKMLEKKFQVPTVTSHLRKKVHLGMDHQTTSHANQQ